MKKLKKIVLCSLCIGIFATQIIYAATTYTDARTWSLTRGQGYSTKTTTGEKLGSNKETDSKYWIVYTVSRTMISSPKLKLVNSNGEERSEVITAGKTGQYAKGDSNTGTIGYALYLSVKPGALQFGTDTIKLQMKTY